MQTEAIPVDVVLDILGNKTRRQILQTLAEEPRYLLQLSKELNVSSPALVKHLQILERNGVITSFWKESDLGAPPRKYFQLETSIYLSAGITSEFVRMEIIPLPTEQTKETPHEVRKIIQEVKDTQTLEDVTQRLERLRKLLVKIDQLIKGLDEAKSALLALRRDILRVANETMREISKAGTEKRMLQTVPSTVVTPKVELLSAKLDIRARTVDEALAELKRTGRLSSVGKTKAESHGR